LWILWWITWSGDTSVRAWATAILAGDDIYDLLAFAFAASWIDLGHWTLQGLVLGAAGVAWKTLVGWVTFALERWCRVQELALLASWWRDWWNDGLCGLTAAHVLLANRLDALDRYTWSFKSLTGGQD
jgi:hypothetical protein